MSITNIRRLVNYGGLRFGQGPLTSSSSPLWDPQYGAIEMGGLHQNPHCMGAVEIAGMHQNPHCMGAVEIAGMHQNPHCMGAIEYGGFYGEAEQDEDAVSYIDRAKVFLHQETKGLQNKWWLTIIGLGVAYLMRDKIPFMNNPKLRRNLWVGPKGAAKIPNYTGTIDVDGDGHRGAAFARWAMEKGDLEAAKKAVKLLDGRKLAQPDRRGEVEITKGRSKGRKAGFALDFARRMIAAAGKPSVGQINQMNSKELKAALDAAGISQTGLTNNAKRKSALKEFHHGKANPKRRKNGTKKGQVRKTARRAYMKKNGTKKGQRRKTARRAYMK